MFQFASPWWLLAAPLPALLWHVVRRQALRTPQDPGQAALLHPHAEELARLQTQFGGRRPLRLPWLWVAGCAALFLALARPQWLLTDAPSSRHGRDIMLALDVSGSMRAQDFQLDGQPIDRLTLLKRVVASFLEARRSDRLGIIIFGDDAFTLAPLTPDIDLLIQLVNELDNGIAGEKTALGTAVALGVERLRAAATHKVLVLFTDGSHTAGGISPEQALELARREGVRVYTVGIGSHAEVAFPGAPSQTYVTAMPLNEALLRLLASDTGGRYFLGSRSEELADIAREIDRIETTSRADLSDTPRIEWFWLPLAAGLGLLYAQRQRRPAAVAP